ncbi:hypothetical protein [Haloarchaeobius sp. DFWS5]|uniref:hypothetical protein n=1 Tax=Haloarchaeobius sp. DFWS5 TaxID=3446114 RepID=UPI003EBF8DB3
MGLLDSLVRLFRSPPEGSDHEEPQSRSTPAADPDRMYASAPDDRPDGADDTVETSDSDDRPDASDTPPTDPPELFAYEAVECTDFWHDYPLDFTVESLAHLDSLVAENWTDSRFAGVEPDPAGTGDERAFYGVVQQFGSYLGETLVRDCDATWGDAGNRWVVVVAGPDGEATVDVFRITAEAFSGPPDVRRFVLDVLDETGRR